MSSFTFHFYVPYRHSSKKIVDDIYYFHEKTALTTIIMLGISIVLFGGNSSSELSWIFIYFSS